MKNKKYQIHMENFKGRTIDNISRTKHLVHITLGEPVEGVEETIRTVKTGGICINVECSCRMVNGERSKIIFASNDLFEPKKAVEWTSDFDWNVQGENLFDELSHKWLEKNEDVFVRDYRFNDFGDLALYLSNGDVFEAIVNVSWEDAWWFYRLDEKSNGFVVTGEGIFYEKYSDE